MLQRVQFKPGMADWIGREAVANLFKGEFNGIQTVARQTSLSDGRKDNR